MKQTVKGRAAALGMGAGIVLAFELALRLFPSLAPPAFLTELARVDSTALITVNPQYPLRFFSSSASDAAGGRGMRMAPHPFTQRTGGERGRGAERRVRIVVAGGSSVQGFPHPRRLAATSYLQAMLSDAWPGRQVEVFNAGITAVASFCVARTVEDALEALEPDLVVVYAGHNELYGVYGAASLSQGGDSIWLKHLTYGLNQLRLTRAMRSVASRIRPGAAGGKRSLLQVMSQAGMIAGDDSRRDQARANLRANLEAIERMCAREGVPLMLCTLVSNETGFAPASADPPPTLSEGDRALWLEALRAGRQALFLQTRRTNDKAPNAEASSTLLEHLESAATLHDADALLQFLTGRCLAALGRGEEAHEAFELAQELDSWPWRAPPSYAETIGQVAQSGQTLFADVNRAFHDAAPTAGVGWDLMADHLHPSAKGQAVLARAIVSALGDSPPTPPAIRIDQVQALRIQSDEAYRRRLGDLPLEKIAIRRSMAALLSEPPLDRGNEEQAARLKRQARTMTTRLTEGERRGLQSWQSGVAPDLLVVHAADQLFATRDYSTARSYYNAARMEEPYTVWGDLWSTFRIGRMRELQSGGILDQGARGEISRAMQRLRLLSQAPGFAAASAAFLSGYGYHLLGQRQQAMAALEEAVGDPGVRRRFTHDLLSLLVEELIAARRYDAAVGYVNGITAELGRERLGQYMLTQIRQARSRLR